MHGGFALRNPGAFHVRALGGFAVRISGGIRASTHYARVHFKEL